MKKQEELKREEELKRKEEELKKQEDKKQNEIINDSSNNNSYYYECYIDGKKFKTEKGYLNHFKKLHNDDYPFYCDECNLGFYSYEDIRKHSEDKGHKGY